MADAAERWSGRFFHNSRPRPVSGEINGIVVNLNIKSNQRKHLILAGPSGVGKTHTSSALRKFAMAARVYAWSKGFWPHPPRIEWVEWAAICDLDKQGFRSWIDGQKPDGVRPGTSLLFLEDIGCEVDQYKTGEPTERLRQLFNEFKDQFLVVTTNIKPDDWEKKWDVRVSDRLRRNSEIVVLTETKSFQEYKK